MLREAGPEGALAVLKAAVRCIPPGHTCEESSKRGSLRLRRTQEHLSPIDSLRSGHFEDSSPLRGFAEHPARDGMTLTMESFLPETRPPLSSLKGRLP